MADPTTKRITETVKELYVFLRSGRWDEAKPKHFAALHGWCHKCVVGYWPRGYTGATLSTATLRAARMWREVFCSDPYDMVDYIRWVWLLERERMKNIKWMAKKGTRVTDELLFIPGRYLIDYRNAWIKRAKEIEKGMRRTGTY